MNKPECIYCNDTRFVDKFGNPKGEHISTLSNCPLCKKKPDVKKTSDISIELDKILDDVNRKKYRWSVTLSKNNFTLDDIESILYIAQMSFEPVDPKTRQKLPNNVSVCMYDKSCETDHLIKFHRTMDYDTLSKFMTTNLKLPNNYFQIRPEYILDKK